MTKNYILKPFESIQDKTLLAIGVLTGVVISCLQLLTHMRSIAILKQVTLKSAPTLVQTLSDFAITTIVMTLALFVFGKIINKKTRLIDILNTVLIARICLDISVLFDINGYLSDFSLQLIDNIANPEILFKSNPQGFVYFIITSFASILCLVGFGYYIYQGFKLATHLKKKYMIIAFVLIILLVDTLTRLITTLY
ncbi:MULTISPECIES: hypothetical protein [Myroides]|uniref:Yip1 domain-containing protein n=2 Tax=Myroides odoratimimus TaxID=76832 RepID=A0AAI8C5J5_9FLAO|nr:MULTISPECIES: hypothetical protein [Myroides]ALU26400.1 hypothetical protein AS202_09675 [Myroides odoratimimus]APA92453.1 hypothetical protein BK054_09540 [Myroides sp. ZB35]EHO12116.1 hypothetical protein HMPREF9712_00363 [Myroides odoratimimus CCUG 10230]MCA4805797.1 hypothetical protein [Myroides odoratimimus]MCS7472596.1 hypothetical protein [Myroides odoratimimus]